MYQLSVARAVSPGLFTILKFSPFLRTWTNLKLLPLPAVLTNVILLTSLTCIDSLFEPNPEMVANLMAMGFPKDQVELALRAAYNNAQRAVDYLTSGATHHRRPVPTV